MIVIKNLLNACFSRKVWRQIHNTLGVVCFIGFFIVCLTGGLYLFRDEIARVVEPNRYYVENVDEGSAPIPLDQLVKSVEKEVGSKVETIVAPKDQKRTWRMILKAEGAGKRRGVLCDVDQYSGNITGLGADNEAKFFMGVRRWHTRLNLPKHIGRPLVDVCCGAALVLILTGLRLWTPQNRSGLKRRLSISFKGTAKHALFDSHCAVGFYTTIPLALLVISGLTFTFGEVHSDFAPRMNLKELTAEPIKQLDERSLVNLVNFCLDDAKGKAFKVALPNNPKKQALCVEVTNGGFCSFVAPTVYYWNAENYSLLKKTSFRDMTLRGKFRALVRECHMGDVFGLGSKIVFAIGCLGGIFLSLSGLSIVLARGSNSASKNKAKEERVCLADKKEE